MSNRKQEPGRRRGTYTSPISIFVYELMKDGGERPLSEIVELAKKAMPDEENVGARVQTALWNL